MGVFLLIVANPCLHDPVWRLSVSDLNSIYICLFPFSRFLFLRYLLPFNLHYLPLYPQSSLVSHLPVLLSCPLCRRVPQPRITLSVEEVGRQQCCCKGLEQGLLWAARLSWPDIPSLSERPCGWPVGVEADGHIPASPWKEASRTAPSVPSQFSVSSVPGQMTVAKLENLQNVTNKPVTTAQLLICHLYEINSINQSSSSYHVVENHCLLCSCKGLEGGGGAPDKTLHTPARHVC